MYLACALAMLTWACAAAASDVESPIKALQQLGTQIKLATDQADAGHYPTASSLAALQHALDAQHSAAESADDTLQHKLAAVSLLFGKLQYLSAHPAPAPARSVATRASIDVESVTSRHGASCATALGISESLPVRITLAQPGSGQSDAWFRFEPAAPGHFRITTDSSGADPAIEVFQSCAIGAASLAANDDDFGLDAAVAVAAADRSGLIVHLTNSGGAGSVTRGVQGVSAAITGQITDAATGLPLSGAQVVVFNSYGSYQGVSASTDQFGSYRLPVDPGTYYVRAFNNYGNAYISTLYPNAQCGYNSYYYDLSNCPVAQAETVSVDSGATASNINIALSAGQRISGVVRDNSNQPLASSEVVMYDNAGNQLNYVYADSFGRYSFPTLPPGVYKVAANAGGYGRQMFNQVACGGPLQTQCDLTQASPIGVTSADVTGINFNLPLLATIQGTVTASPSPTVSPYQTLVTVVDANGNTIGQATADPNGHYSIGPLAVGSYYAYAAAPGYFSQIFDGIDCAEDCFSTHSTASVITITQPGQLGTANFQLSPLPLLHGHVQDAANGMPLANVTVVTSILPPYQFSPVSSTVTDSNGNYTLQDTPAGKFYVWAQSADHVDQIYSGITCEADNDNYGQANPVCDVTGATILTIAPGQTPSDFNFALQAASSISGRAMINAGPGSDLPAQFQIYVYNGAGVMVAGVNTDSLGNYIVSDLPSGTYFVAAGSFYSYSSYVLQIWQMMDCLTNCAVTMGTPVVVGQNVSVTGIDFSLTRRDGLVGRITDASGAPLAGVLVDLFDSTSQNYVATGATDAQGFYTVGGSLGSSYFVATEATGGYIDQVYAGISCPLGSAYYRLCPFSNAMPVGLGYSNAQPHIVNFVLQSPPNEIFASDFE